MFAFVFVWFGFACKPPETAPTIPVELVRYEVFEGAQYSEELSQVLPGATIDASLQQAAQILIAATRDPERPMSVRSMLDAKTA